MLQKLQEISGFARLEQLPRLGKRALGLGATVPSDFLCEVDATSRQRLVDIAENLRGSNAPPAIFVHGVLPRSGTNFLADVLGKHPDVAYNPDRLWEFPLLHMASSVEALQREFRFLFPPNAEVMGQFDMLGYLASGWMQNMQLNNAGKRMLLKSPHVQNIGLFRALFPRDILVLCLRDGRDVAFSSLGTFGSNGLMKKSLRQLATEWAHGCDAIMSFEDGPNADPLTLVVRYEDLVTDPVNTTKRLLRHAGLDDRNYDFSSVADMPVRGSSTNKVDDSQRWQPQEKSKDFNPIGRWQSWPDSQKSLFDSIAGPALARAGYTRASA